MKSRIGEGGMQTNFVNLTQVIVPNGEALSNRILGPREQDAHVSTDLYQHCV
jgi:hypothetical protein